MPVEGTPPCQELPSLGAELRTLTNAGKRLEETPHHLLRQVGPEASLSFEDTYTPTVDGDRLEQLFVDPAREIMMVVNNLATIRRMRRSHIPCAIAWFLWIPGVQLGMTDRPILIARTYDRGLPAPLAILQGGRVQDASLKGDRCRIRLYGHTKVLQGVSTSEISTKD